MLLYFNDVPLTFGPCNRYTRYPPYIFILFLAKESCKTYFAEKPPDVILIDSDDEITDWNKKKKGKLPQISLGGTYTKSSGNETDGSDKDVKPDVGELDAAMQKTEVKEEKPDVQKSDTDIKPDVEKLNAAFNISNVDSTKSSTNKETDKTATPSAAKASKSSSPEKKAASKSNESSPSGTKKKSCASKSVQTTGDESSGISGPSANTKKELEKTKKQLRDLQKNVSSLLKVLVPELEVKDLSLINDIVVEMIKVNSQQNGEGSESQDNGKKSQGSSAGEGSHQSTSRSSTTTGGSKNLDNGLQVEIKEEPQDR